MSIIVPFQESKYLCISSLALLYPIHYCFKTNMNIHGSITLCTMLVSINFWRNATYSWRRNLDLFFSKFTFLFFVLNGLIYIPKNYMFLLGMRNSLLVMSSYYFSNYLWEKKNKYWILPHVCMHGITAYGMHYILTHRYNVIRKS